MINCTAVNTLSYKNTTIIPITISCNHTCCAAGCGTLSVFFLKEPHFSNVDPLNFGGGVVKCEVNDIKGCWILRKLQRNDNSYNGGTGCGICCCVS